MWNQVVCKDPSLFDLNNSKPELKNFLLSDQQIDFVSDNFFINLEYFTKLFLIF